MRWPIVPGVIRTLDGKLSVGAPPKPRNAGVDSAKTSSCDGSFRSQCYRCDSEGLASTRLPSRRERWFLRGLTTIETTPLRALVLQGERLHVSLRGKNGHFVGHLAATPRVSFGGPNWRWKLSFSEVFEYDVRRDPVRGLAWPKNESNLKVSIRHSCSGHLSPQHVFNADVNVFPMCTEFRHITALVPCKPRRRITTKKGISAESRTFHSFRSGALLRIALRYTRFDSNAHGRERRTCWSIRKAGTAISLAPGRELPISLKRTQLFNLRQRSGLDDMS